MISLGINAAFHDSAACIVKDGRIIAAAEEERFTRIKHGKRPEPFSAYILPYYAIDYCLQEAAVSIDEVDHVAYSYEPELFQPEYTNLSHISLPLEPSAQLAPKKWESVWDPLFLSYMVNAPRQLAGGIPYGLEKRLQPKNKQASYQWHFLPHHLTHAASAFYPSPFENAALMTLDGRGEKASTSYGLGMGRRIESLGQVNMPHSLGMLYEEVTKYLGFLHSSDEYKVMALASYGKPVYLSAFRELVSLKEGGQYEIKQQPLADLFGPARMPRSALEQRHFDIAHSLQAVLEETVLQLAHWLYEETRQENLCLAGGVALNCVMNARLRDQGPFKNIWVQPAAGDAGTALGAALYIDLKERAGAQLAQVMEHVYLGPQFHADEIEQLLLTAKVAFSRPASLPESVSDLLIAGKIVAWFQGRMEFGPRALGARSLLASAAFPEMTQIMNQIKGREEFRPVAPAVLEEEAEQWFTACRTSPFMLEVFEVKESKVDLIPAVTHIDRTARVQTVNRRYQALYYDLIKCFYKKTGIPVIVNTSFNTQGQPIVCTPKEALACFYSSPIDALAMGPFLIVKDSYGQY